MLQLLISASFLGAGFGLALAWLAEPFAGALVYGLSILGLVAVKYLEQLKPKAAPLPPELADIKTRLSNLELRSGVKDRGLIPR